MDANWWRDQWFGYLRLQIGFGAELVIGVDRDRVGARMMRRGEHLPARLSAKCEHA